MKCATLIAVLLAIIIFPAILSAQHVIQRNINESLELVIAQQKEEINRLEMMHTKDLENEHLRRNKEVGDLKGQLDNIQKEVEVSKAPKREVEESKEQRYTLSTLLSIPYNIVVFLGSNLHIVFKWAIVNTLVLYYSTK